MTKDDVVKHAIVAIAVVGTAIVCALLAGCTSPTAPSQGPLDPLTVSPAQRLETIVGRPTPAISTPQTIVWGPDKPTRWPCPPFCPKYQGYPGPRQKWGD